jgi:predicted amidohydrolase YtcJ
MAQVAADWILANGRILTFDRRAPRVEAVAIGDDRILAVGASREMRRWRGRGTRWVDLKGATVIPGLVDAHAHLDREGLKFLFPSLASCRSIADIQALLRRLAQGRQAGQWIVTMPVGQPPFYLRVPECLAEKRMPTRWDLDGAAPAHPVYIRGIWGYWNKPPIFAAANSLALRLAGITRETAAPKSVEILKDAAGELTGVFIEHNVIPILEFTLMKAVPRFTHADRVRALKESQRRYHARGVTSVYEGHGVAPEVLRVYRELHGRGALTMRTHLALSPAWRSLEEAGRQIPDLGSWAGGSGIGDSLLRICGIYLGYGGDPEVSRVLKEELPYTGWAGFVEQANDPGTYQVLVRLAAGHGLRVNTIVTNQLREVLDAWEGVDRESPLRRRRWQLIHLARARASDLDRIRRVGAVVVTNPISYLYRSGAEALNAGRTGEDWLPHRALLRARVPFALGTDNKPPDPFLALRAVVARQDLSTGAVIGPNQRLTPAEALRAFTLGGACVLGREHKLGSLTPGKLADLAVLSSDPLSVPVSELPDIRVRLTMVGGRPVHRHDPPEGAEP